MKFVECGVGELSHCDNGYCVCNEGSARWNKERSCVDTTSNAKHCGAEGECTSALNDNDYRGMDCLVMGEPVSMATMCGCGAYYIPERHDDKRHKINEDDEARCSIGENGKVRHSNCRALDAGCVNGQCQCDDKANEIWIARDNKCHDKLNDAACCGDSSVKYAASILKENR